MSRQYPSSEEEAEEEEEEVEVAEAEAEAEVEGEELDGYAELADALGDEEVVELLEEAMQ